MHSHLAAAGHRAGVHKGERDRERERERGRKSKRERKSSPRATAVVSPWPSGGGRPPGWPLEGWRKRWERERRACRPGRAPDRDHWAKPMLKSTPICTVKKNCQFTILSVTVVLLVYNNICFICLSDNWWQETFYFIHIRLYWNEYLSKCCNFTTQL